MLDAIRERLSAAPHWTGVLFVLTGAAALALLVLMGARFLSKETRPEKKAKPDSLRIALGLLELDREDQHLLRAIAEQHRLTESVAMLLTPRTLAFAASPLLDADKQGETRKRLDRLSLALFGAPLPSDIEVRLEQPPPSKTA